MESSNNSKTSLNEPRPPSTIESLYSQGPIGSLPDVGPQRVNPEFEKYRDDRVKKGRTRPLRVDGEDVEKMEHERDPVYWYGSLISFIVIITVTVILVLIMAAGFYRELASRDLYRPYGEQYQPPQQGLLYTLIILTSLLLVGASHRINLRSGDDMGMKYIFILILVIALILLVIWSFFFFNNEDPKNAFITSIILALTIIGWACLSWSVDKVSSGLLLFYLVFVGYLAWISWDRHQDNLKYTDQ